MKSEEFVDEGLGDMWRSFASGAARYTAPIAKTGVLGGFAKRLARTQIAGKEEAIGFSQNFVSELQREFTAATQSGLLAEFSLNEYSGFELLLERMIGEATTAVTADTWLDNIISGKVAQYHLNSNHKDEYVILRGEFKTAYEDPANKKKFPMEVAKKLGDWLYRVAISQQREGYRNRVDLAPGQTPGLGGQSSFGTPKLPTKAQWDKITQDLDNMGLKTATKQSWVGQPLAFRDDNSGETFQFNFTDKKWYNTTGGAIGTPNAVEVPAVDVPKLNAMFVQKINAEYAKGPTP